MKAKRTRWFPPSVNPVRIGWYEWEDSSFHRQWDGERWRDTLGNLMPWPKPWRGLAKKPKGGAV